jgi:hypothetical protein
MDFQSIIIVAGACLLFFLLTFLALVDVARKDFSTGREKVLWWIVASIPFVGGIIYLIAGYRRGKRT